MKKCAVCVMRTDNTDNFLVHSKNEHPNDDVRIYVAETKKIYIFMNYGVNMHSIRDKKITFQGGSLTVWAVTTK